MCHHREIVTHIKMMKTKLMLLNKTLITDNAE